MASHAELMAIARSFTCAECGGRLVTPWDATKNAIVLVCGQDRSHDGYAKVKSLTQLYNEGEEIPVEIKDSIERKLKRQGRQQMTQEHGEERATALAPYEGSTALTKEQATFVLQTIWPDAPEVEIVKAAITCASYHLNPLMRHLFLIPFKNQQTNVVTWSQVLGIGATRLIASRRGGYNYKDGPRLMTEQEQKDIRGEVDQKHFWAITVVSDLKGNRAPGYGNWPKNVDPKGTDKGNTKQNMAFIRSERTALDRLFPGEMPGGVDVVDEGFLPAVETTPLLAAAAESVPPATQPAEGRPADAKDAKPPDPELEKRMGVALKAMGKTWDEVNSYFIEHPDFLRVWAEMTDVQQRGAVKLIEGKVAEATAEEQTKAPASPATRRWDSMGQMLDALQKDHGIAPQTTRGYMVQTLGLDPDAVDPNVIWPAVFKGLVEPKVDGKPVPGEVVL